MARSPSVPPAQGTFVFVGRQEELRALEGALLPVSGAARPVGVCALHGMPGVGKSYLIDEFARRHADRFPGGYVKLSLGPNERRDDRALFTELSDRLGLRPGDAEAADFVRERLLRPKSLLHIENVDARLAALAAAAMVRHLGGCAVAVTGRLQGLGLAAGWATVQVRPLSEEAALEQLSLEYRQAKDEAEREDFRRLVRTLGGLPLGIHLAAGHLRAGRSAAGFLEQLRKGGLTLEPMDPADPGLAADRSRAVLRSSFELSLERLREELGEDAEPRIQGLAALGYAPAAGVGRSLGAAMAGLPEDAFEDMAVRAQQLSLLDAVPERAGAWGVHPLIGELLRGRVEEQEVIARMTAWFIERLPEPGEGWKAVNEEVDALLTWLAEVPAEDWLTVERAASMYAQSNGPFGAWMEFCERALIEFQEPAVRSSMLWTLCLVARHAGAPERSLSAAEEKVKIDRQREEPREVALAMGVIAGALQEKGEIEEALRIRREEVLPVYDKLGDTWLRAVAMVEIADVLVNRGNLDEALRIYREEVLPVCDELGQHHSRAVTMGKIAGVFVQRGDLDEALHMLRDEVLPTLEKLGSVRDRAVTMSQIADIYKTRGELDEALRILRDEVLPVLERHGAVRDRAASMGKIADIYMAKGELDEALRIQREEVLPVYEKLGAVRDRAVSMSQIAAIYRAKGELDEALRIHREEVLPVYEKFGAAYGRAVNMGDIADIYMAKGELDEALRIHREEELPVYKKLGAALDHAITMGEIADILMARGELDEALRIRREEELPIYERLGAAHERAGTLDRIADIYIAKGELDEALRIRREQELPAWEKLGHTHACAVTLAQIVDLLAAKGELDEALRLARKEALPALQASGNEEGQFEIRAAIGRLLRRRSPSDHTEAAETLASALQEAEQLNLPQADFIRRLLHTPILERLSIRNFKNIDQLDLRFSHASALPGHWTCLAGINGAGKSAVLQAIALLLLGDRLAPVVGDKWLENARRRVNDEPQDTEIRATVRDGTELCELTLFIGPQGIDLDRLEQESTYKTMRAFWDARARDHLLLSYGAGRNLSAYRDSRHATKSDDVRRQMTLFDPLTQVADVDVLLEQGEKAAPVLRMLKRLLSVVLEGTELSIVPAKDGLHFAMAGAAVAATDLPDGFRATIAWLADLCAAWHDKSPEEAKGGDPAQIRAIVLIDEIDLHLHPSLQRLLVPRLRKALPEVQWIVSTHSPLVLASFDKNELIVLDAASPDGKRSLDRQILGFSTDEVYEWLMDTEPRSAALEGKRNDRDADERLALILAQSPEVNEQKAQENQAWRGRLIEKMRRKEAEKERSGSCRRARISSRGSVDCARELTTPEASRARPGSPRSP